MLADAAAARADGKLDLMGVGWDTIGALSVPVTHPRMDLVLRFLLAAHELRSTHTVVVSLLGPDGELGRMEAITQPWPEPQRQGIPAGRKAAIGMVLNFVNTAFPDFGAYHLAITWDGTEAREPIRLFVQQLQVPPQISAPPAI